MKPLLAPPDARGRAPSGPADRAARRERLAPAARMPRVLSSEKSVWLPPVALAVGLGAISRSVLSSGWEAFVGGTSILALTLLALVARGRAPRSTVALWIVTPLALSTFLSTLLFVPESSTINAATRPLLWMVSFSFGLSCSPKERAWLIRMLVAVGAVEALLAILEGGFRLDFIQQSITAAVDRGHLDRPNELIGFGLIRAEGTLGYPIPLAHFLCICLFLALLDGIIRTRYLKVLVVGLLLVGIAMTGTRTSVIAVVLGVGVILVGLTRKQPAALSLAILTFVLGAWSALQLQEQGSKTESFTHRFDMMQQFVGVFSRVPLVQLAIGWGQGSHEKVFESGYLSTTSTMAPDNGYMMVFIEGGMIGLASLALLILHLFRSGSFRWAPVTLTSVVFLAFYDGLSWTFISFVFFMLAGAASAVGDRERSTTGEPQSEAIRTTPYFQIPGGVA